MQQSKLQKQCQSVFDDLLRRLFYDDRSYCDDIYVRLRESE